MNWTLPEALALACRIEVIAPFCGAHIGLTGGCLYKPGPRKDLDFVVYRIRQEKRIDRERFFALLADLDIHVTRNCGFVVKATLCDRAIDFLFPETEEGTYGE